MKHFEICLVNINNYDNCNKYENWRKEKLYFQIKKSDLKNFLLTGKLYSDKYFYIYYWYRFLNENNKTTLFDIINNDSIILQCYPPFSILANKIFKYHISKYDKNLSDDTKEKLKTFNYSGIIGNNLYIILNDDYDRILIRNNNEDLNFFFNDINKEIDYLKN
jgi:hypothetical protein